MKTKTDITKYLSERWRKHYDSYGGHLKQAYTGSMAYPRMSPDTARGDAWPPNGGPPGSDLDFMRKQHLDANNIEYGILHPLRIGGYDERNMDFSQALCTAINDWQIDAWVGPEPRLRGSIYVPQDYPEAAVKEIERRADDPRFVQGELRAAVRRRRSASAATGRSSPPPVPPIVRLRCISAAFRAIRRPARAGRRIISSTISPTCRRCCRW